MNFWETVLAVVVALALVRCFWFVVKFVVEVVDKTIENLEQGKHK